MNVDIRIVLDVTQGEVDFLMSPQDDSFVVLSNYSSGYHDIFLDSKYMWSPEMSDFDVMESLNLSPMLSNGNGSTEERAYTAPSVDCRTASHRGFTVKDRQAKSLSTYITLNQCNTLLRVFGLKNRLVLTLPQNAHNLSGTRFFIALKANAGAASYGLVFFRQDQLHIDLFVFFSVFFSCFFLFLAICVVAWKAKQASDTRRARRRHVVEMLHMAKRPFGKVNLQIDHNNDVQVHHPKRTGRIKHSQGSQHQPQSSHGPSDIAPVSIEPLAFNRSDGVAAINTVFIRLPGKYSSSPVCLALGSSLVVLSRNYSIGGRNVFRRRGSHHQNQNIPQLQQQPPA